MQWCRTRSFFFYLLVMFFIVVSQPQRAASKRPTESAPVADDTGDGIRKSTVHRRKVSGVDAATRARSQAVRPSLPEIAELLEEAVHRLMKDYNTARREVLYGLDEQGRPLEENGGGASGEERRVSNSRGRKRFASSAM